MARNTINVRMSLCKNILHVFILWQNLLLFNECIFEHAKKPMEKWDMLSLERLFKRCCRFNGANCYKIKLYGFLIVPKLHILTHSGPTIISPYLP